MKFGPVKSQDALGAILAHSIALPDGRLRKGVALTGAHIERLQAAGISEVTVARLEAGDVHEDEAARTLAEALVPDLMVAGLRASKAATGRVNLFSEVRGVAEISRAQIDRLNAVDPMITVATVPEWQRMGLGGMVATVKIISYAVSQAALEQACEAGCSAMRMRPTLAKQTDLIQTIVGQEDGEKGHQAIRKRVEALGASLGGKILVPHQIDPLAGALRAARGDVLFILTGSATSDIHDVAPEAVRRAGGQVHHFGMPVDPGNLLFIGEIEGRPVIGLPGCARSPALNGADWVLERVLCGVEVGSSDIQTMGVGGLLKEIPSRPQPREGRRRKS